MSERIVNCHYYNEQRKGLTRIPMPGDLGQKIFDHISENAWQLWLREQTKLINEYRLDPMDSKAIERLNESCRLFLFNKDS